MAAAMAELTRQNQELTREIERQGREGHAERQSQSQEDGGRHAELETQSRGTTSRRVPHLEKEMDQMRKLEGGNIYLPSINQILYGVRNWTSTRRSVSSQGVLSSHVGYGQADADYEIGTSMKEKAKEDLVQFLKKNADVFAWSHDDITGIDPSVITHRLNVSPSSKPIRQKKRVFAPKREKAIKEEVQKLTTAQFIQEVYYPDWLANVVMVKKGNAGHQLLSFIDAFSRYNQIKMDEADQEKTSFITIQGLFCYKVMPFGLKNVGATYQRLVNHMFRSQIGQNVKILRKAFEWTDECQRVFQDLKHYLTTAPILSPSMLGEELYLYLAVSPHAVSSALIREEEKVQKPVYYTSRALRGAEGRYPLIEKLAFALITASRKLRHYFQGHVVIVMTDHPLKKAMNKLEASGRLIQWAVELSEFDIRYQPTNAIKALALADFIAEFTPSYEDLDEKEDSKKWVVHVDGSSTLYTGGIRVVLQSPEGDKLKYKACLQYQTTNNEVEYEAFLKGLELARSVEASSVLVLGDSQLVIGQVNGTCEAKEDRMKRYLKKVLCLVKKFREANFVQILREENMEADTLAKEASANEAMDKLDEIRYMPSIDLPEMLQIEGEENWMTLIVSYLKDGRLLEGKDEAKKLRVKSTRYILMDEVLYKRGFSQPYLKCLAPDEANYILSEVHEGEGARPYVQDEIKPP
nr:uncharacterized protein LOC112029605 [Quercus suber]